MSLLLDTHAFLWFVQGDKRLSTLARREIESADSRPLLSLASIWEISIKVSLGKLAVHLPVRELIERGALGNGIGLLPIQVEHACAVANLAFHHRDPFDRLMVAQTRIEGLTMVSMDTVFDAYRIPRIW